MRSFLSKALALVLAVAFLALPVRAVRAEVVETKIAYVYTEKDAVEKAAAWKERYNLQVSPKEAVKKFQITELYTEIRSVPATTWDAGDVEYTYTQDILTTLQRLEQTVSSLVYTLPKQRILVLPLWSLNSRTSPDALGVYFSSINIIYLAAQHFEVSNTLLHEIGHSVADALLATTGYDWSGANLLGREYLRVRGYPSGISLSKTAQLKLDWDERAAEMFAEDFAYWAATKLQMDKHIHIPGTGKPEVLKWFDKVLGDATVPIVAYNGESCQETFGREVVNGRVYVPIEFFRTYFNFTSDELLNVLPSFYTVSYAIKGTIYVPLRKFAAALGLTVHWDGQAIYVRR